MLVDAIAAAAQSCLNDLVRGQLIAATHRAPMLNSMHHPQYAVLAVTVPITKHLKAATPCGVHVH